MKLTGTSLRRAARGRAITPREMAAIQSAYYLPTAAAPFMSRARFEAITGPKLEWWLVQTVGALIGVIGGTLAVSAWRDEQSDEVFVLGVGSALALGTIDVVHVARRRISPVYLADAIAEFSLAAGWAAALAPALRRPRT
jgi:hypothetical protein